jgi:hypothetical protein
MEGFCRTPVGGELPLDRYQCPQCRKGWRIRGPGEMTERFEGRGFLPDHPDAIREPDDRLVRVGTVL